MFKNSLYLCQMGAGLIVASLLLVACQSAMRGDEWVGNARHVRIGNQYLQVFEMLAQHPMVVDSIQASNESNELPQSEIEQIDEEWRQAGEQQTVAMVKVLNNPNANYLRTFQKAYPEVAEVFLIDQKGCLSASNIRTTDYWQGDEAKWSRVFKDDRQNYFISGIGYDLSTRTYLHHYSIPVFGTDDELIGVLVAGVAVR